VGGVGKRIRADDEQEDEERPLAIARTSTTMTSAVDFATHPGESAGGAPLQVTTDSVDGSTTTADDDDNDVDDDSAAEYPRREVSGEGGGESAAPLLKQA